MKIKKIMLVSLLSSSCVLTACGGSNNDNASVTQDDVDNQNVLEQPIDTVEQEIVADKPIVVDLQTIKDNSALINEILIEVFDKQNVSLIDAYFSVDLVHHFKGTISGRGAIEQSMTEALDQGELQQREIVRTVAQGEFVAVHQRVKTFLGDNLEKTQIVAEVFKVTDGAVAEYWKIAADEITAENTASGNSMLEGGGDASLSQSIEELSAHAEVVEDFFNIGFTNADTDLLDGLLGAEYIQHNPYIPNGRDAVLGWIGSGTGVNAKVQLTIAQGDLVFSLVDYGEPENPTVDIL